MQPGITRRVALRGLLLAWPALQIVSVAASPDFTSRLRHLEQRHGGRLGVAFLDLATGLRVHHRANERFPLCSTFKFLAAALVLARVDRGEEQLQRRVAITQADLANRGGQVSWSPETQKRIGGEGMTISELCAAAITQSDNTAANLLLASFGGPLVLTNYARSLGDSVTRLDRLEPEVNDSRPGDPRDTTSPAAMLEDMRQILCGAVLSEASRQQLIAWLVANQTGDNRLRVGLPPGWQAGDKTGTCGRDVVNDIAIFWPPTSEPCLITAYFAESRATDRQREAVLAEVAKILFAR
ncbi:MAG: class A beta-lactamase [Magnetococcales bacterium]|nr:class A beta-lactamase [Magnetococcales bacterium]